MHKYIQVPVPVAARSKDVGLRQFACCDHGFESRRGHGCLSVVCVVCCQVEVSATSLSLVQEESYRLWRGVVCDKETSCDMEAINRAALQGQRIIIIIIVIIIITSKHYCAVFMKQLSAF
jgi:hypothetical protein